jgi:CheY-like chemotaxis protein
MIQPATVLIVLLVEDSPDDVFFFRRAISKIGSQVITHVANDGVEAINYLSNQGQFADPQAFPSPSIIFLDLKLPHLNGFEVLEWANCQPDPITAPVIILSSSNEPEDRKRAETLGAAFYMTKPPTPENLREILTKYLI